MNKLDRNAVQDGARVFTNLDLLKFLKEAAQKFKQIKESIKEKIK